MYTQEPRHEKHQWRGSCVIKENSFTADKPNFLP